MEENFSCVLKVKNFRTNAKESPFKYPHSLQMKKLGNIEEKMVRHDTEGLHMVLA